MEEREKSKFEYSPEVPNKIKSRFGVLKDRNEDSTNWFEKADDIFNNSSEENEEQKPMRISGNSRTLLQTMTQGDIQHEIVSEARKGILDDFDPKETGQDTIQGIVDNLEDIEYRNNENTFEYNKISRIKGSGENELCSDNSNNQEEDSLDHLFSSKSARIWENKEYVLDSEFWNAEKTQNDSEKLETNNSDNNSKDVDEVSAKLMAKIQQMKELKKEKDIEEVKRNNMLGVTYQTSSPLLTSPWSTKQLDLATVHEQDEINHRKNMKHRRVHSGSSNNMKSSENDKQKLLEHIETQKAKEMDILKTFKVISNTFIFLGSSISTKRDA